MVDYQRRPLTTLEERLRDLTTQVAEARAEIIEGLPADAIRQKDALEKYALTDVLMATWIRRGHVRQYAVVSHKMRFVSEDDIRRRLGQEPLSPEN